MPSVGGCIGGGRKPISQGLKPAWSVALNVWAKAQTYLRNNNKNNDNSKSKDKSNRRFPTGMTNKGARAKDRPEQNG